MSDQALAVGLEEKPLVMALEELGAKQLFQTLELLADSGLRQVQQRSGAGSAPVSTTATKARNRQMSISRRRHHLWIMISTARHKRHSISLCKRKAYPTSPSPQEGQQRRDHDPFRSP